MSFQQNAAALLALCLCAPAARAEEPAATGSARAEFALSDGSVRDLTFTGFAETATRYDPEDPMLQCAAPWTRVLEASMPVGNTEPGFAVMKLDFNEYRLNRPTITLDTAAAQMLIAVDLRANSTPGEIALWQPEGEPRRDGADWVIRVSWDFTPAPSVKWNNQDPAADPEITPVYWLDPQSGEQTGLEVEKVRVTTDLRLPATWPDDQSGALKPCP